MVLLDGAVVLMDLMPVEDAWHVNFTRLEEVGAKAHC
jgi:hypothetical protein